MNTPKLTLEQHKLLDAIDCMDGDAGLEGVTIDPLKIEKWKDHVMNGMAWEELFEIITSDKEKIIAVAPKPQYTDSPGLKHMGNGYFLSYDETPDPPVK